MSRLGIALSAAALLAAAAHPHCLRAQGSPAAAAAPAPRTVTPSAQRAAEELLRSMHVEEVMRGSTESAFDAQVKAQPLMAPFRATMQQWANKYLTWAEFGPKLTQIYAEEFTEPELRELTAFYNSPIGRKVAELSPLLTRRAAQVGADVAQAHMTELQQMIQARAAELQQEGKTQPQDRTPPAAPPSKKP